MSHKEFVLAYEDGSVGCSISTWLTFRLFVAGRIREKKVRLCFYLWLICLPVAVVASILGFLYWPVLWATLNMVFVLLIFVCTFFYGFADVALSVALENEEFFEFAKAHRALWIYSDDENNLPKTPRTVHKVSSRGRRRRL